MANLTTKVYAEIDASLTGAPTVGTVSADQNVAGQVLLNSGTGSGNADIAYVARRSLAGTTSENLDLAGVLTDVFGNTVTAAKVKAILVVTDSSNNGDLVIGAAATNPFVGPLGGTTPTIAVRPGGLFLVADPLLGWTVTAGTGDLLKVNNLGAGVAGYRISVIASSV
jgi:hypothetical protein